MSITEYNYSISTDFPAGLSSGRLVEEIRNSTIVIALDHISTSGDVCSVWFKDQLSVGDEASLDSLVSAHSGLELPNNIPDPVKLVSPDGTPLSISDDGILLNVSEPRTGTETIYTSHNYCDKVSWFGESTRVNDKTLTSNDGHLWETGDTYIVDMISGRVQDDDGLADEQRMLEPGDPHGYQVVVTVDGQVKQMREPFTTSGGDYEVFWEEGQINSFSDWTGKTVTASYSKANGSTFVLKPLPGYILRIEAAEADFSLDVEMNDSIEYSIWGYAAVFAPQLGLPGGTKIPLKTGKYKKLGQIVNEAIGTYPICEVYGSKESDRSLSKKEFNRVSRGTKSLYQSIPFRYATTRDLKSSYGLELRTRLVNNVEFGGQLATLTFYCTSKQE